MRTRERRLRERVERRATILAAARDVFRKMGYAATTMPRIAEAAELAPGTLYLYFPSKNTLYAELLFEGYDILQKLLEEEAAKSMKPRERVEALVDVFIRFARRHPQYFDIIFFVVQSEGHGGPYEYLPRDQRERMAAREEACKTLAFHALRAALPERGKLDLRTAVDAVWSMLAGVVFFYRKDDVAMFERVAHRARGMILDALFAPNPDRSVW